MTIVRIYYGYMALAGAAVGVALTALPQLQDFWLRPYFWMLIAVALFDGAVVLMRRNAPWAVLGMSARLIGFAVGLALMVAVPTLAGVPVKFF